MEHRLNFELTPMDINSSVGGREDYEESGVMRRNTTPKKVKFPKDVFVLSNSKNKRRGF